MKGRWVAWWKIDNLLMSTQQMLDVGLIGKKTQLKIWI